MIELHTSVSSGPTGGSAPVVVDCAVVGGGPAGLTAAHYLRRFHRNVVAFDAGQSRAARIPLSRNYPGFPDGISGVELLARMSTQLSGAGGTIRREQVTSITRQGDLFLVQATGETLRARAVILATGTCDLEPDIEGIDDIRRHGLLRQCPVCDGFESSARRIVVVGRGTHGRREAAFMRTYSQDVEYVDLGVAVGEIPAAVKWALPVRIERNESELVVTLTDGSRIHCDVLYSAMGSVPASCIAADLGVALDPRGNILVDQHCRTSVPGLFAVGDVVAGLDQIAVAVGQAAEAATTIHNDLRMVDEAVPKMKELALAETIETV